MNASKENCRKAKAKLNSEMLPDIAFVREFLDVAERKLPTEAAYRADKKRRKERLSPHTKGRAAIA